MEDNTFFSLASTLLNRPISSAAISFQGTDLLIAGHLSVQNYLKSQKYEKFKSSEAAFVGLFGEVPAVLHSWVPVIKAPISEIRKGQLNRIGVLNHQCVFHRGIHKITGFLRRA